MEDKTPLEENSQNGQVSEEGVSLIETVEEPAAPRKKKVYKGMWGPLEIFAVGASLLILILVIAGYLVLVFPESRQLEANRARRDDLEKELARENRKFGSITSTENRVSELVSSAEDFESRFLREESVGKTAVYQRLNSLIDAFGLVNSTGPDYVPLELSENERRAGANQESQSGRSRFQSLFPGIYITMTVEGSYLNIRKFLNELENSSEYMVISSIELEPSEAEGSTTATGEPGAATVADKQLNEGEKGRTRGRVVSLRLELAAYFQRSNESKLSTATIPEETSAR